MAIAFDCPTCGKSFSVADEFAGRVGSCKGCGHTFKVPEPPASVAEEDDEWAIGTDGYSLAEAPRSRVEVEEEVEREGQNVFSRTYDQEFERPSPPRGAKSKAKRRKRKDDEGFFEKHGKLLMALGIGLAISLVGVAMFMPGGKLIVAVVLCSVGLLLIVGGYFIGLAVAFSEDSLYGWLSIMFPIYQSYYLVTRWDEMWPWFVMQMTGVGLITVGGLMLDDAVKAAAAKGDACIAAPAEGLLVLRPWLANGRFLEGGA